MVRHFHPKTYLEAVSYKKNYPNSVLVAGGSDVMVVKKKAETMIYLNQIMESGEIKVENGYLCIGSGVTFVEIMHNELVPKMLREASSQIASPAIRNVATLAGNICNASPAGDSLPVLYALNAEIVAAKWEADGTIGERVIPIEKFILGIRKIDLQPEEMVIQIRLPISSYEKIDVMSYEKIGARKSEAISKLSFAAWYHLEENRIDRLGIAFGSVGITVVRSKEIENKIIGLTVEELHEKVEAVIAEYDAILHPIDDQRSTKEYRKKVCLNLLKDFLEK